ncbi:EKC/KEOPS complex subunit TPRKB-like [Sipha flava]|jgi:tRNA threonylcarbamoyladenosine modification (KEOPS) complex Cgi121 subunit|uniref:EKC/KEOPS complex subunit TPRKB-like n=1 Tax=Sipha flava TaxID=143950 RepID=A0A2S2R090_9HEMI|nr:EKC/KEOPS complex subunit TPRKB-like [Sipha flava]
MKIYHLENEKYLGVSYFTDVKNIKWLKENMASIFKDKSPILIRSCLIVDPFQIVVAVNNAFLASENSSMKTRSLVTEVLFNLSSTNKISKSLTDIGPNDNDNEMIVALVSKFPNVPEMKIFHDKCIKGCETNLSQLLENINEDLIKTYYKISQIESETSSLLDSVVTRIACKSIL